MKIGDMVYSENTRVLTYLQDQLRHNPTKEYLVVDLDEYLEQMWYKASVSEIVRKEIEDTLNALFEESYTLYSKNNVEDRKPIGQTRLIQSYKIVRNKDKYTYSIKLTDTYRKILLNDKPRQWEVEFENYIVKVERPTYTTVFEREDEILDEKEKEYLSGVIRPFKDEVEYLEKLKDPGRDNCEYIDVELNNNDNLPFPSFKKRTMYKGMEVDKKYTLEELGLD